MRKKLFISLLLTAMLCCALLPASLTAAAASTNSLEAVYPFENYQEFSYISSVAVDEGTGTVYVLEQRKKVTDKAKLTMRTSDGVITELPLSRSDPRDISFANNQLYVLYKNGLVTYDGGQLDVGYGSRSFAVSGNNIYILWENTIAQYDTAAGTDAEVADIIDGEKIFCFNDEVYYLDSGLLYKLGEPSPILSQPSITDFKTNESLILFTQYNTLNVYDKSKGSVIATMQTGDTYQSGIILEFSTYHLTAQNEIYVGDDRSKSVQRFVLEGEELLFGDYSVGSFSSDEGKFHSPSDVIEQSGKKYVLDGKNSRIQIFSNDGKTEVLPLEKDNYHSLEIASNGNLIFASDSEIVILNGRTISGYSGISSLHTSFNGDTYFAAGKEIYQILENEQKLILTATAPITSFSVDLKNESLFYATENEVFKHSLAQNQTLQSVRILGIIDMDIDFGGNLYFLDKDSNIYTINLNFENEIKYSITEITFKSNYNITAFKSNRLAIDKTTGEILICNTTQHLISKFTGVKAFTENDIPLLKPTVDILNKNMDIDCRIAQIGGWPSTIIYPFHPDLTTDPIYPAGHTYTKITRLYNSFPEVIILETIDNYYYVMYENKVGFILSNKVSVKIPQRPPFEDGVILHANANVYSIPSAKQDSGKNYVFQKDTLQKGDNVLVLDTVCDYKDLSGIVWYKIRYGENNGKTGYIARDNATKKTETQPSVLKTGKIKAIIAQGNVEIYDVMDENAPFIAKLRDGADVNVLEILKDGWLYIEGTDLTGKLVRGYVKEQYVTSSPLTTSQIVGICMISATSLLLISAVIVVKIFKTKSKKLA